MKKLLLFAASLAAFHLQAQDTNPVSETKWYRLTTQFQGDAKSLDVIEDGNNDKLSLAKTGNFTGQSWKFTPIGNGWYRLTCQFQGDAKSLDVISDGNNDKLTLAKTGNFTGQYWKLTPVANGYYRLTCQFQGDAKSLDVINDGNNDKLTLAKTGNFTGQYWKITELPGVGSGTGPSLNVVASMPPPALGTPLTIGLGDAVTIEGKLFAQKFATSAEDPKFKGETAFLPIVVLDRKLAFKFSAIDQGYLHGKPPAEPVDRIELAFKNPLLLAMHEKNEGKPARIEGTLIIDQDNRLLPVKLEVTKLEVIEPAGKPKPASLKPGSQPRQDIPEFWKVALAQWKAGPITKLDEEEVDGTVQTHTSGKQAMITKRRETGESGYTITQQLINTEKFLLAVREVSWTNDPWKLTETVYEFGSSPARKHFREQKMKQHFHQLKSKPESVEGAYATEELDEKAAAAVKKAHPDWWEGGLK